MATWRLGSVTIDGTTSTASISTGVSVNRALSTLATSSDPTSALRILNRVMYDVRISVHDIALVTTADCVGLTLHFRQSDGCGGVSATWISLAAASALVFPEAISASGRGPATLTIRAMALSSDGSSSPWVVGAVSGSTTVETNAYQIETAGVTSASINFGYRFNQITEATRYLTTEGIFMSEHLPTMSLTTNLASDVSQTHIDAAGCGTLTCVFTQAQTCAAQGTDRTYALTGELGADEIEAAASSPGTTRLSVFGNSALSVT